MPNNHTAPSSHHNIILIGMMGTGKSAVGKMLSIHNQLSLIDTDALIEKEQKMSISDMFEKFGEPYFRALETTLLRTLMAYKHDFIISTGGGIILSQTNRDILKQLGFVVWLNAMPKTIIQRVGKSTHRPLLQTPTRLERISHMLDERAPLYEACAHMKIDTDTLSTEEIAYGIRESSCLFFSQR